MTTAMPLVPGSCYDIGPFFPGALAISHLSLQPDRHMQCAQMCAPGLFSLMFNSRTGDVANLLCGCLLNTAPNELPVSTSCITFGDDPTQIGWFDTGSAFVFLEDPAAFLKAAGLPVAAGAPAPQAVGGANPMQQPTTSGSTSIPAVPAQAAAPAGAIISTGLPIRNATSSTPAMTAAVNAMAPTSTITSSTAMSNSNSSKSSSSSNSVSTGTFVVGSSGNPAFSGPATGGTGFLTPIVIAAIVISALLFVIIAVNAILCIVRRRTRRRDKDALLAGSNRDRSPSGRRPENSRSGDIIGIGRYSVPVNAVTADSSSDSLITPRFGLDPDEEDEGVVQRSGGSVNSFQQYPPPSLAYHHPIAQSFSWPRPPTDIPPPPESSISLPWENSEGGVEPLEG